MMQRHVIGSLCALALIIGAGDVPAQVLDQQFRQSDTGAASRSFLTKAREAVSVFDFTGVLCNGTNDDSAGFQRGVDALNARSGGTLTIPALPVGASCRVRNVVLKDNVFIEGAGQRNASIIRGYAGEDIFTFQAGSHYVMGLSRLTLENGRNHVYVAPTTHAITYFIVRDVEHISPENAAYDASSQIEEWFFDNVRITGGNYGFKKTSAGTNRLLDKSTFKDVLTNGQAINGWRIEANLSTTVTWINPVINTAGQHGFYSRVGSVGWFFINANTEGNGQTSLKTRTTGSITSGGAALTVASAAGFANGQPVTVQGAGERGADLTTTISSGGGTVNLTLAANAATTVTSAQVTNSEWDDFHFAGGGTNTFIGGVIGSTGTGGYLRYAVHAGSGASKFLHTHVSDAPVYDQGQVVSVLGGNTTVRVPNTLTTDTFNRTFIGTASNSTEFAKTVVPSPRGRDWIAALIDSNGNGTGTRGNFDVRRLDGNRTSLLTVLGDATGAGVYADRFWIGNTGASFYTGYGAPEGVLAARIGSVYLRQDGGAGTSFCVKESGAGNTGWACK